MRPARLIQRLLKLAAIFVPFALVLAACAPATPVATPTPPPPTPTATVAPSPATPPAGAPAAAPTYTATGPTIDRIKNAGTVNVLVLTFFPPLSYTDENGQIVGANVDLANEFAKDLGVSLNLVDSRWATIFEDLNSGKGDAAFSIYVTDQRKNYVLFSTPYLTTGDVILVRADNDSIKGPNDLAGKVVGVLAASAPKTVVEGISGVKEIREYQRLTEAFDAVVAGDIDAAVTGLEIARFYAEHHPALKLASPEPFARNDIAIALAKDSTDLQAFANQFVDNIERDGRLDQILSKYGLK